MARPTAPRWADAFADLQQALAVAEAGDEVWVAEGTYLPAEGGVVDRDASFVLVSGTALYGGFSGSEVTLEERDPEANVTVLSGDLGVPGDSTDNAFHVVVASGVDSATLLDGFTVTGGFGNGGNPRNRGAGLYAVDASLKVRDCRIVENTVVQTDGNGGGGGAFFGSSGAPRFERVVFERNGFNGIGGGLWVQGDLERSQNGGAEAELARQERGSVLAVPRRPARREGGGGPVVLREVEFVENTGSFGGGTEMYSVTVIFAGVTFERNVAFNARGGLSLNLSEGDLVNVRFQGNTIEPVGSFDSQGGMSAFGSTFTLTNAAFVGNTARISGAFGGGIGGSGTLTNVTFASNEATEGGAIRTSSGFDLLLHNSVLWGNGDEVADRTGTAVLSHVLVAGGCPPESACKSILDTNPLFTRDPDPGPDGTWGTADDDYGDLRLQEDSPAIDFGLTSFLPPDTFDLDGDSDTDEPLPLDLAGEARVTGDEVDLGAYERQPPVAAEPEPPTTPAVLEVYPNPTHGPASVSLSLARPAAGRDHPPRCAWPPRRRAPPWPARGGIARAAARHRRAPGRGLPAPVRGRGGIAHVPPRRPAIVSAPLSSASTPIEMLPCVCSPS